MKTLTFTCAYCLKDRDTTTGWHNCPQAQAAKASLQAAVSGIQADMLKPGQRRMTSSELKQREDRRHEIAGVLSIKGYQVVPEYSNGND